MSTPPQIIAATIETFLATKGPVIASDAPVLAERIWSALMAEKAKRQQQGQVAVVPTPEPESKKPRKGIRLSGDDGTDNALAAIEQCGFIISATEELPSAGWEFGESVAEKCRDIVANIETHDRVTPGQQEALDNMQEGVARWFHD